MFETLNKRDIFSKTNLNFSKICSSFLVRFPEKLQEFSWLSCRLIIVVERTAGPGVRDDTDGRTDSL